jgi:glutathionylspermidine synthase
MTSLLDRMQTVDGERRALETPLTIARRDWDEIAQLTDRFGALIERTIDLCLSDSALLDWYGFSPRLRRMVATDVRYREPVALARYDVFRTPDGWRLSEFNTDVPGGVHEAHGLNELVVGDPEAFTVVERLTDIVCRDSARPTVGIIYASGYGDDLEQCQYLRQCWNRRGVPALLGNPENLVFDGARLRLFGHPLDVVYRYFPAEWLEELDRLPALLNARRVCRILNGFGQLVAQSKKVMAFWYEHLDLFTPRERELIETHVPRTTLFRPERLEDVVRDRERLVVKRGFGRVGEQVLMGTAHSPEEWREALEWPISEPGEWIVQDRFEVVPQQGLYPCFGAYAVGGRFAGLYTRAAREPFITYDAFTVGVRRDG